MELPQSVPGFWLQFQKSYIRIEALQFCSLFSSPPIRFTTSILLFLTSSLNSVSWSANPLFSNPFFFFPFLFAPSRPYFLLSIPLPLYFKLKHQIFKMKFSSQVALSVAITSLASVSAAPVAQRAEQVQAEVSQSFVLRSSPSPTTPSLDRLIEATPFISTIVSLQTRASQCHCHVGTHRWSCP